LLKPIGRKKGFTFIELVIVLSILAVLAGIVTLSVTMYIGRGRTEACNTDQHSLQSAVASYYHANDGTWPTDTEDASKPGDLFADGFTSPLVGDYITKVPKSDTNCDWQLNAKGMVIPNSGDCPCD
jgi:prepilin-type N-terminal cleavage/methylation domain-containing protein